MEEEGICLLLVCSKNLPLKQVRERLGAVEGQIKCSKNYPLSLGILRILQHPLPQRLSLTIFWLNVSNCMHNLHRVSMGFQPSNGLKSNHQPSKVTFYHQPSKIQSNINRKNVSRTSNISFKADLHGLLAPEESPDCKHHQPCSQTLSEHYKTLQTFFIECKG